MINRTLLQVPEVTTARLTCPLYVRKYLSMCSLQMDGCRATSVRNLCRDRRRRSMNSRSVDTAEQFKALVTSGALITDSKTVA